MKKFQETEYISRSILFTEYVEKDEEIDDEKRKKVLATAYLMIGEADKALELLNDK